jgi:peptidyl-tRNA hydrolase
MSKKPKPQEEVPIEEYVSTHAPLISPTARIVVAVAKTLIYGAGDKTTYKMEPGRQIAQACHAVSGLKLRYCEEKSEGLKQKLYNLVVQLIEEPITTIVLQARDTREILHLAALAEDKGLLHFCFADDNYSIYKTTERIPSAVAIGPVEGNQLYSITDYLPLWKDGVSDVP